MTVPVDTIQRQTRRDNYRIKRANDFACAECGRHDGILAVTERATGALTTRCEHCLDRRTDEVRPGQWDEAAELATTLAKKS